ncbi:Serine hydrolase FSH [Kalmanozyma brasiliensis GHG001]|uniref:Serine hydrolase domain-containing protein n=1 Tax=Kalmanozyma brasiliensis (strain GHG001) TaxID=1365824 RepID=V5EPC2_KALBG|nr:Serine hydrolase FSH [Kalmanozyma brasiliensis GHG001]EST06960.1 Serine hydrolase FSH [Kalmanozyma brasiliensis GHG001]
MSDRKTRLLALHGKGTSGRIMKTQIKPIVDVLGDVLEVHYMDGSELSAPYQGIESIFPKQKYYAWYQQPTREALQLAHDRIAMRLSPSMALALTPHEVQAGPFGASFLPQAADLPTPPETPSIATPMSSTDQAPKRRVSDDMAVALPKLGETGRPWLPNPIAGMETPRSYPSTAGVRTPLDADFAPYDGLICFSQGCAASTGLLLALNARLGCKAPLPVQFVILICGGRPFEADGSMERVQSTKVTPIAIRSVHIHGLQDPNYEESKRLACLYSDVHREVIELDIGHCPPRRTADVHLVAAAIRRTIAGLY